MSPSKQTRSFHTPIASRILEDGSILEIVLNSGKTTSLLHFDGTRVQRLERVEIPDLGRVVPYSARNNLITHKVVLLPSEAAVYSDERALLSAVRAFIRRYADLSDPFEEVASLYVLLSWVYDKFTVLPYLRLRGDFGTGKSRGLQVIGSLCYRPMFVSGASTVSPIFRIIDSFRGTLVIDESDFRVSDDRVEIVKILNNGNAVGFPVLRSEATPTKEFNPRAFNVFGPKIIATRREFDDQALESRCITEVMRGLRPRADIPLALPPSFDAEALALRNQLLMYRFNNVTVPINEERQHNHELEPRIAQVFAPLIAVAPDEDARAKIGVLAARQTGILRSDRSTSVEAQLLDTLNAMRGDGVELRIREIAERFAERFGDDYDRQITARWIGGQLRRKLSLVPVRSHGSYLLPSTEESKLLDLFERYQISAHNAVVSPA